MIKRPRHILHFSTHHLKEPSPERRGLHTVYFAKHRRLFSLTFDALENTSHTHSFCRGLLKGRVLRQLPPIQSFDLRSTHL